MALTVSIDTTELSRLTQRLPLLTDKAIRFAIANAMTEAGRKAQAGLQQATPRFIESPTRWTLGGIPQRVFAKPSELAITLGFATERRGRGSPAGRYVNPLAAGTGPHLKGMDLAASKLARAPLGAVLVPARSAGLVDGAGNVPLRRVAQIVGGARQGQGYFVAPVRRGSTTMAVFEWKEGFMRRSNTLERTVRRMFTIEPSPKTRQRQFPVADVVREGFAAAWRQEMARALDAEVRRVMGTG